MRYLLFALLIFATTSIHADPFRDGVVAYQQKKYTQALEMWLPLAQSGHVLAQTLVGSMYAYGEGIEQNNQEAFKWLSLAANTGSSQAQFNLAILYEQGLGVTANNTLARKWFKAAADQGRKDAARRYALLEKSPATPIELVTKSVAVIEPETETEAATESEPVTVIEPETEAATESASVAVIEPETEAATESASVAVIEPETEAATESASVAVMEPETEAARVSKSDTESITVIESEPEAVIDTESVTDTFIFTITETDIESDAESDADSALNTITYKITYTDTDTKTETSIETETNIRAETEAENNTPASTPTVQPKTESIAIETPKQRIHVVLKENDNELLGPPTITSDLPTTSTTNDGYGLDWARQQPVDNYTIQLASSVEPRLIEEFKKQLELNTQYAQLISGLNGTKWHALIFGSYVSVSEAKRAIDKLPANWKTWQPWIKRFSTINAIKRKP